MSNTESKLTPAAERALALFRDKGAYLQGSCNLHGTNLIECEDGPKKVPGSVLLELVCFELLKRSPAGLLMDAEEAEVEWELHRAEVRRQREENIDRYCDEIVEAVRGSMVVGGIRDRLRDIVLRINKDSL